MAGRTPAISLYLAGRQRRFIESVQLRSILPRHSDVWRCFPGASVARRQDQANGRMLSRALENARRGQSRDARRRRATPHYLRPHRLRSRASQGVHSGHMGNRSFRQNEVSRCRRRASRALSLESKHRREGISARINSGRKNGAFNRFEELRRCARFRLVACA